MAKALGKQQLGNPQPNVKMVGLRLETALWEQVRKRAWKEGRTLSKWVERAIRAQLSRRSN